MRRSHRGVQATCLALICCLKLSGSSAMVSFGKPTLPLHPYSLELRMFLLPPVPKENCEYTLTLYYSKRFSALALLRYTTRCSKVWKALKMRTWQTNSPILLYRTDALLPYIPLLTQVQSENYIKWKKKRYQQLALLFRKAIVYITSRKIKAFSSSVCVSHSHLNTLLVRVLLEQNLERTPEKTELKSRNNWLGDPKSTQDCVIRVNSLPLSARRLSKGKWVKYSRA